MRHRQVANSCTGDKEKHRCGKIKAKKEINSRVILYYT